MEEAGVLANAVILTLRLRQEECTERKSDWAIE